MSSTATVAVIHAKLISSWQPTVEDAAFSNRDSVFVNMIQLRGTSITLQSALVEFDCAAV